MKTEASIPLSPFHCPIPLRRLTRPEFDVEGEGLAEGVTVVTLGSYALPQETKVRILKSDKGVGTRE